ncbi:hypothetical protein Droror1_Dr00023527 [Drosera rotundifolia]
MTQTIAGSHNQGNIVKFHPYRISVTFQLRKNKVRVPCIHLIGSISNSTRNIDMKILVHKRRRPKEIQKPHGIKYPQSHLYHHPAFQQAALKQIFQWGLDPAR